MQPATGYSTVNEKTWGRGWVVLVVKKKPGISLISRVRTRAGTRQIIAKNMAKTPRRQLGGGGDICYLENICRAGQT